MVHRRVVIAAEREVGDRKREEREVIVKSVSEREFR